MKNVVKMIFVKSDEDQSFGICTSSVDLGRVGDSNASQLSFPNVVSDIYENGYNLTLTFLPVGVVNANPLTYTFLNVDGKTVFDIPSELTKYQSYDCQARISDSSGQVCLSNKIRFYLTQSLTTKSITDTPGSSGDVYDTYIYDGGQVGGWQ